MTKTKRTVLAHVTFEFLMALGVERTWAFDIAWRMWAK